MVLIERVSIYLEAPDMFENAGLILETRHAAPISSRRTSGQSGRSRIEAFAILALSALSGLETGQTSCTQAFSVFVRLSGTSV